MAVELDRAKLRAAARADLASLAVHHGVIDALSAAVDEKWRDVYATEAHVRIIFRHLGLSLRDGPFDHEAAAKMLKGAWPGAREEAAKAGEKE